MPITVAPPELPEELDPPEPTVIVPEEEFEPELGLPPPMTRFGLFCEEERVEEDPDEDDDGDVDELSELQDVVADPQFA